jgi:hypothetical protein
VVLYLIFHVRMRAKNRQTSGAAVR